MRAARAYDGASSNTDRVHLSVYVDNARLPFRRRGRDLLMSHMLADTTEELERMARAVGLPPWSIQSPGTYREHYDVTADMRERAISLGAVAVDSRFLVRLRRAKRAATRTSATPGNRPVPAQPSGRSGEGLL